MKFPKLKLDIDWVLVVAPILLSVAGIATLFSITSFSGRTDLATSQVGYFIAGMIVYFPLAFYDYKGLRSYSWYLYLVGIVFLVLVAFFGMQIFGSKRWIDLKIFQFQPSETMKFIFLIFSTRFIAGRTSLSPQRILVYIFLAAVPIVLILLEPDLGTALTAFIMVVALLMAVRISKKYFLVAAIILILFAPLGWKFLKPYQKTRITSFVNPASDPLGSGYNVNQSRIAVGSGGLYGKGFGEATQSQLQFLPIAQIDFIFAGWAEATGFVGSIVLIAVYGVLIWRIFAISNLALDESGRVICVGVGTVFFFQSFVNIGMNIGLMPVTGIPLPLVSYGGTSFITSAALLGLVQSAYIRRKSLKFE